MAKEQKQNYEFIKEIKTRLFKNQPTTFQERNIVKIYDKRMSKKKKYEAKS